MIQFFRSFRVRLMLAAVVWTLISVVTGGFVLSEHVRTLVADRFEDELRGHADELLGLVEVGTTGQPSLRAPMNDPQFLGDSGFYWQVGKSDGVILRSYSLHDSSLLIGDDPLPEGVPRLITAEGPGGPAIVLVRSLSIYGLGEHLRLAVGADKRLLDAILSDYNSKLFFWLVVISGGMMLVAFAQVTFGLKPLERVRIALAAVHSGLTDSLPDDLPSEVQTLASDMNTLLAANQGIIRRSRAQAGNLAHSLKTPLALLMHEGARLEACGHESGRVIVAQCQQLRRQIDYQMAQARATASRSAPGVATRVIPNLEAIISAISSLYRDKCLVFKVDCSFAPVVACDSRDLDDILGNLLDNAAKWAASEIKVTIGKGAERGVLSIRIEDDGPGLPEDARERVFNVGERLDEQAPGTGLGLAIVKDFAELYGGRVWFETAQPRGTAACLELPEIEV